MFFDNIFTSLLLLRKLTEIFFVELSLFDQTEDQKSKEESSKRKEIEESKTGASWFFI